MQSFVLILKAVFRLVLASFSQFTSMLDLVGSALKEAFGPDICGRLDGSMTADKREAAVRLSRCILQ